MLMGGEWLPFSARDGSMYSGDAENQQVMMVRIIC
jgi:hypothetical protein